MLLKKTTNQPTYQLTHRGRQTQKHTVTLYTNTHRHRDTHTHTQTETHAHTDRYTRSCISETMPDIIIKKISDLISSE